jgi:hypothetical protein
MNRMTPLGLAFVLLCGCPSAGDDRLPQCTAADDLALNTLTATVDGDVWTGATNGASMNAGPSLYVSATGPDDDGDSVNIALRLLQGRVYSLAEDEETVQTADGELIEAVLADQQPPYDFTLGDASEDGANATVTKAPPSMSSGEGDGGGFLRITAVGVPADGEQGDPEEVSGCFFLTAEAQDGSQSAEVTDGSFRLTMPVVTR